MEIVKNLFEEGGEEKPDHTEEAINHLNEAKAPSIVQHGENSQVYHITQSHSGDGDIISSDEAEMQKLKLKVKMLERIIDEMEQCVETHNNEHRELIEAKDDEISILKSEVKLLKEELHGYKLPRNGLFDTKRI